MPLSNVHLFVVIVKRDLCSLLPSVPVIARASLSGSADSRHLRIDSEQCHQPLWYSPALQLSQSSHPDATSVDSDGRGLCISFCLCMKRAACFPAPQSCFLTNRCVAQEPVAPGTAGFFCTGAVHQDAPASNSSVISVPKPRLRPSERACSLESIS